MKVLLHRPHRLPSVPSGLLWKVFIEAGDGMMLVSSKDIKMIRSHHSSNPCWAVYCGMIHIY
jgi:hypothetical protein